jgi:hypothetical protein
MMYKEDFPMDELIKAWGFDLNFAVCERCDWKYLYATGAEPQRCPYCFQAPLTPLDLPPEALAGHMATIQPAELSLPFSLSTPELASGIERFSRGIPFHPADLTHQSLSSRLNRVYLPLWLVDAEVQAGWQAEAGFDYEVVSHEDHYDDRAGGWTSQQVKERRVRWEPRLGRLKRTYSNIPAPALEKEASLKQGFGQYRLGSAQPYDPLGASQTCVRLPDRAPQDAWSEAVPALQAAASEECREAAGADHIRGFRWSPEFCSQNWTMLLRPAYTTYYLDDDQNPQPVWVNAISGEISGQRRASVKRGRQAALVILGIALALFLLSLALSAAAVLFPPLLPIGGIGLFAAVLVALGAVIPPAVVWQFNRSQRSL